MVEVDVLRWRARLDIQRTREAYAQTERGGAAECACAYCRNYLQQREHAFPPEALQALEKLGIPADKDLEVVEYGPTDDGRRLYGAWFYVVGELVSGGPADTASSRAGSSIRAGGRWSDEFEVMGGDVALRISTETVFVPPPWEGLRLLMVDVYFPLPWILAEQPA